MTPDREKTVPFASFHRAVPAVFRILQAWKGSGDDFSALNGMRVLDLAAGTARPSFGGIYDDQFQPHFSRLCAINGANVTAVDINPQGPHDQALFTSVEADLVYVVLGGGLQSLPILQGKKFDLIHSANFVGRNYCPELQDQLAYRRRGLTVAVFETVLLSQAGELLAEGGLMTLDEADEESPRYTRRGTEVILILQN